MPSGKNFLLLAACLAYANASTSSKEVYSSLLTAGGSNTLRSTGSVMSSNIYAEELSCSSEVDAAQIALELSYTYSIETLSGASLDKIISDIEGELLLKLADTVVYCSDDSHVEHVNQDGFDRSTLGIVGINSKPQDTPSELSTCESSFNECNIIHGHLTLFLKHDHEPAALRHATRLAIKEAIKSTFLSDRIEDLIATRYNGPHVASNKNQQVGAVQTSGSDSSSTAMSAMNKVVIATLASCVVGIVAAFVLFKKVFNNTQNCFAACDGTGIDKNYIENAHFASPTRPGPLTIEDLPGDDEGEEMQVVQYDIANGLSVIEEGADDDQSSFANSYAGSYAMSSMSVVTSNSRQLDQSCDASVAMSVASETTIPTSNRYSNRTPAFGEERDLRPGMHII